MSEVDHEKQRAVLSVWAGGETPMARACSYFLANDADLRRELSEVKELARRVIAVLRGKGYHDNGSLIAGGEAEKAMMELSDARGALEGMVELVEAVARGDGSDHTPMAQLVLIRTAASHALADLRPKPEPAKEKEPCGRCHGLKRISLAAIKLPETFFDCPFCNAPPPSPESGKESGK